MYRAACSILLLTLVVSLPAAAGDEKFRAALRDAVVKEVQERKEANDRKSQDKQELPVVANVGERKRRNLHGVFWSNSDDTLSIASCPMGGAGAPTFNEVRNYYRDYTDDEMWKICVNRSSYQGAISGACACSLLAYPNPWRPVESTRESEHPDVPYGSIDDLEPVEPISNPEPEDSEK